MNTYNDETIILSNECVNAFMNSLLLDKESRIHRDDFIADVKKNVIFADDGSMIVNVPDIDFDIAETFEPVETIVSTIKMDICVNVSITVKSSECNEQMRSYDGRLDGTEYSIDKMWKTSTQELGYVA